MTAPTPAGAPASAPALTIDALGRKCPIPIIMLAERIREDETEATAVDAELDARDIAGPPGGRSVSEQPWWESDPRFADRFRPVEEAPRAGPPNGQ